MKTKYGIPQKELDEIEKRDTDCVYCHKKMINQWDPKNRHDYVTIEHLNHRKDWDSVRSGVSIPTIIAICCWNCNTNRGAMSLHAWFNEDYCKEKNINYSTVAPVVKKYIDVYEN